MSITELNAESNFYTQLLNVYFDCFNALKQFENMDINYTSVLAAYALHENRFNLDLLHFFIKQDNYKVVHLLLHNKDGVNMIHQSEDLIRSWISFYKANRFLEIMNRYNWKYIEN